MSFSFPVETVMEGAARIVVPDLKAFRRAVSDYAPSRAPVFYNPVMQLNRDMAVLTLQAYQGIVGRGLSVSEPLAGCGVRGIRFAKEVDGVDRVELNDINPEAFKLARYNIRLNGLTERVSVANEDANLFLSQHAAPHERFDFVDVDPFGAPAPYMDSAIRALRDGGMLALTATDLAPLCGVFPKAALRKYGGLPLRTEYCHEIAVRLLAGRLVTTAASHDIGTRILFSHSTSHYIRVYASASHGARKADESLQRMGYVLHCFTCLHRETTVGATPTVKERCDECGSAMRAAGPLWLGRIADKRFCELMEKEASARNAENKRQIRKMLFLIKNECDAPTTYYVVDKICDRLGLSVPALGEVVSRLQERGFCAAPTHFHSRGVRTDASATTVTATVREIAGQS